MDSYTSAVAYHQAQRRTTDLVREHELRRSHAQRPASIAVAEQGRVSRAWRWLRVHVHLHRGGSGGTPAVPAV